jgi:hypothetical protein
MADKLELVVDASQSTRRQRGLLALALGGGSLRRAAAMSGISENTLKEWRGRFREEYERVCRDVAPRLEAIVVNECYARVIALGELETLAMEKLEAALANNEIPARDLPGALRNITTSKAINVDKILALSGRPTQVIEHRSMPAIYERLSKLGALTKPVEGTATPIEP